MQGLSSYASKSKGDHRRWAWNRIRERCGTDAVGLYLCGPDDIDRQIATEKGFRNSNLIAVDYDEANIARVRKAGGIGICGRLQDILQHWNDGQVDFILYDSCSTIVECMNVLYGGMFRALKHSGTIYINMQRGREPLKPEYIDESNKWFGKHRGHWVVGWAAIKEAVFYTGDRLLWRTALDEVTADGRPAFSSYVGSRVVMDGIVCKASIAHATAKNVGYCGRGQSPPELNAYKPEPPDVTEARIERLRKWHRDLAHSPKHKAYVTRYRNKQANIKRKLAALKAVRTKLT